MAVLNLFLIAYPVDGSKPKVLVIHRDGTQKPQEAFSGAVASGKYRQVVLTTAFQEYHSAKETK